MTMIAVAHLRAGMRVTYDAVRAVHHDPNGSVAVRSFFGLATVHSREPRSLARETHSYIRLRLRHGDGRRLVAANDALIDVELP